MAKKRFWIIGLIIMLCVCGCGADQIKQVVEKAHEERLAGNPQKAVEVLLKVLEEDPTNIEAIYELAEAYEDLGDLETAAKYYQLALDLDDVARAVMPAPYSIDPEVPDPAPVPDGTYPEGNNPDGNNNSDGDNNSEVKYDTSNAIFYEVGDILAGYLFEGHEVRQLYYDNALDILKTEYPDYEEFYELRSIHGSSENGGFDATDDGHGMRSTVVYTADGGSISVVDMSKFGGGTQYAGAYNYSAGGKFSNVGRNIKDVLEEVGPGLYDAIKSAPSDGSIQQWNDIQIMKFSDDGFQIMQGRSYIMFNMDGSGTIVNIAVTIN